MLHIITLTFDFRIKATTFYLILKQTKKNKGKCKKRFENYNLYNMYDYIISI